uniref:Putative conserved secreted protein n=1 Tax=Ixodes ricinus TaxID=34613 RepID=A0A6B0U9Q8_IXORI
MNAVLIVTFVVVGTLASQVTGLPSKSLNLQARFDDLNHWCYGQTCSNGVGCYPPCKCVKDKRSNKWFCVFL